MRVYLWISGVMFGAVAAAHCVRVVNQWPLVLGPWSVPMWVSLGGAVATLALCLWAFRLAGAPRE